MQVDYNNVFQICHDQKWSPFTRTDIQTIAGFFTLEKPISEFARKLETNQIPTSSLLFPGLKRLLHELKVFKQASLLPSSYETFQVNSANSHLSHLLLTVLSSRFVEVLTSIDEQADPFYLAASFLDPTIAFTLGIYEHAASRVIKTMAGFMQFDGDPCHSFQCSRILNNGAVPTSPSTRAVSMLGILSLPPAENLAILEDLDREIQDYLRWVLISHTFTHTQQQQQQHSLQRIHSNSVDARNRLWLLAPPKSKISSTVPVSSGNFGCSSHFVRGQKTFRRLGRKNVE